MQMRGRSKARFMQGAKKRAKTEGVGERERSGEIEVDRSQLIGGLYSSDSHSETTELSNFFSHTVA